MRSYIRICMRWQSRIKGNIKCIFFSLFYVLLELLELLDLIFNVGHKFSLLHFVTTYATHVVNLKFSLSFFGVVSSFFYFYVLPLVKAQILRIVQTGEKKEVKYFTIQPSKLLQGNIFLFSLTHSVGRVSECILCFSFFPSLSLSFSQTRIFQCVLGAAKKIFPPFELSRPTKIRVHFLLLFKFRQARN